MTSLLAKFPPGNVHLNVQVPRTVGGGFWPHLVDIYRPLRPAVRALVSLHGGGGNKGQAATSLRITKAVPATLASVNWAVLELWRVMAVFPQGQACSTANATANAFNPNAVNTISLANPFGITTWSDGMFWSGYNDVAFLQDLRAYLLATYPALSVCHLHGHSAGGIMVHKMMQDSPGTFGAYLATSAPQTMNNITGGTGTNLKPFWCQYGRTDDRLGILGGIAGPGDHFGEATWRQQPENLSLCNVTGSIVGGSWVPSPAFHEGATITHQRYVDDWNTANSLPPETYSYGGAAVSTPKGKVLRTWTHSGGARVMRLIEGVGHKLGEQQSALGKPVVHDMMSWIGSL